MALRVAVFGIGDIALKGYMPVLPTWEGIELFLYSRSPEKLAALQTRYRVSQGGTSLEAALEWGPQAAFVLTPFPNHAEFVAPLLRAGTDVFVEKPATGLAVETRELAELADAQERILMVGFNRRYAPLHRKARDLWGSRPVDLAVFQKTRTEPYHTDVYGHMIEDNIHTIDTLRFFCGEVAAVVSSQVVPGPKPLGTVSALTLSGGGAGLITFSLHAGAWSERYELHGGGASMYIDAFDRLVFSDQGERRVWRETYASSWQTNLKGRGFEGEIAHFFDCVRNRQKPETSAWDSIKTQELLEAMVAKTEQA